MHFQQGGDHDSCYTPTKIDMVTVGCDSMKKRQCVQYMTYCMAGCLRSLVWPQGARSNTSDMAYMYTQRGGDHNPCYTLTKIGMVTGGIASVEIGAVRSLHDLVHATVFQIIVMVTQNKSTHF